MYARPLGRPEASEDGSVLHQAARPSPRRVTKWVLHLRLLGVSLKDVSLARRASVLAERVSALGADAVSYAAARSSHGPTRILRCRARRAKQRRMDGTLTFMPESRNERNATVTSPTFPVYTMPGPCTRVCAFRKRATNP